MEALTVKGLFLKNLVEAVRKERGSEGVVLLEKRFGQSVKFSSFKDYPMELELKLHFAAVDVLYGGDKPEGHFEFGKIAFQVYADSVIGKTVFSLLGNDIKKVALAVSQILNTVTSGLIIKTEDMGENKVKVNMENNIYPIEYYQGIWTAGIEYFGHKANVSSRIIKPQHYEYILVWEDKGGDASKE